MVTALGKRGRNANPAVSILVFNQRAMQTSRSEHSGKIKIWIKLVNAVWIVCIERDVDLKLCSSLCCGEQGFFLFGLIQAMTYWVAVITRDEIAEILQNRNKFYLSYTKIYL